MFWPVLFWTLTGAAALAVALLLWRAALLGGQSGATPSAAYDLEVYRDQLRELERDLKRGTIGETEAERARVEISRRILAADKKLQASQARARDGRLPAAVALGAALLLVVGGAYGIYGLIGLPGARDLPLDTRITEIEAARSDRIGQAEIEAQLARPLNAPPDEIAEEVRTLRRVMEQRPDDAEGMAVLARTEAGLGNFRAARLAQERLLTLTADELSPRERGQAEADLAEMMIFAANGYVSPEAEAALNRALDAVPGLGTARFYRGHMFAQQGRPDLAFPIWQGLLAESQPGDPWLPEIRANIEAVAAAAGVDIDLVAMAQPAPTPAEGIAALPAAERQAAIEGMVEGLSQRLGAEGGPAEDWAQLIRALIVLDRPEDARAIRDEARGVFAEAPLALGLIDEAARPLEAQE